MPRRVGNRCDEAASSIPLRLSRKQVTGHSVVAIVATLVVITWLETHENWADFKVYPLFRWQLSSL